MKIQYSIKDKANPRKRIRIGDMVILDPDCIPHDLSEYEQAVKVGPLKIINIFIENHLTFLEFKEGDWAYEAKHFKLIE